MFEYFFFCLLKPAGAIVLLTLTWMYNEAGTDYSDS
jgi:hypothetical protein